MTDASRIDTMFNRFRNRLYNKCGDLWCSDASGFSVTKEDNTIIVELEMCFRQVTDTKGPKMFGVTIPQVYGFDTRRLKACCAKWGPEEFQAFEKHCIDTLQFPLLSVFGAGLDGGCQ